MVEGWQDKIDAAQLEATVEMSGGVYQRIRYGADYPNGLDQCRDCSVEHGQRHVQGCCVERCPRCGGQMLGCPCWSPN